MMKALIKKQGLEMLSFLSGRKGKKGRSKGGFVLYALLWVYVVLVFGFLFYQMMDTLCMPLISAGLSWLYFALAGTMATALGVFGSVFATQSQLYEAKDNELLLSLPIPPGKILLARMLILYIQNFIFEAAVLVPCLLVYLQTGGMPPLGTAFFLLLILLLPLLALALSCVLGWLVALISSRLRNKSIITVVLSLVFLAVYFIVYSNLNNYLQMMILNSAEVGDWMKTALYPLYQMGLAAQGDIVAFFIFAGIVLAVFFLVYAVLSRSFLHIATRKRGGTKARYREKKQKAVSPDSALLRKELTRFGRSPLYMLNCALGCVFLLVGAIAALVKSQELLGLIEQIPGLSSLSPLLAAAVICLVVSMNVVTAPSISLEGRSLWLLQSLPVTGWQVLRAKLKLHLWISVPVSLFCSAVLSILLAPDPLSVLMLLLTPAAFILLNGLLGLVFNLKWSNLDWSSEAVAVKQSISVTAAIFSGWGIVLLLGGLYFGIGPYLSSGVFLLICTLVMFGVSLLLLMWLKKKGARKLETL